MFEFILYLDQKVKTRIKKFWAILDTWQATKTIFSKLCAKTDALTMPFTFSLPFATMVTFKSVIKG
jgi:hypothetical protein